jgi:hypothetical protein
MSGTPIPTVEPSRLFMIFPIKALGPVSHPHLLPGATILENESTRITRPSTSILRKEGAGGEAAPSGRIWRK